MAWSHCLNVIVVTTWLPAKLPFCIVSGWSLRSTNKLDGQLLLREISIFVGCVLLLFLIVFKCVVFVVTVLMAAATSVIVIVAYHIVLSVWKLKRYKLKATYIWYSIPSACSTIFVSTNVIKMNLTKPE